MSAVLVSTKRPTEDFKAEEVTDPGIPEAVEDEASEIIRLTIGKMDDSLDLVKRTKIAAHRLREACQIPIKAAAAK